MSKTPLRLAREARNLTLKQVADAVGTDGGNLSRVERGTQTPSKELTEALVKFYGVKNLSEVQILFPERFTAQAAA